MEVEIISAGKGMMSQIIVKHFIILLTPMKLTILCEKDKDGHFVMECPDLPDGFPKKMPLKSL